MGTKPSVQPCPPGAVTKNAKGQQSSAPGGMQQGAPKPWPPGPGGADHRCGSEVLPVLAAAQVGWAGPLSHGPLGGDEIKGRCLIFGPEDLAGAGRWLWQEGLLRASPRVRSVFKRAGTVLDFLSLPHSGSRWTHADSVPLGDNYSDLGNKPPGPEHRCALAQGYGSPRRPRLLPVPAPWGQARPWAPGESAPTLTLTRTPALIATAFELGLVKAAPHICVPGALAVGPQRPRAVPVSCARVCVFSRRCSTAGRPPRALLGSQDKGPPALIASPRGQP